MAKRPIFLPYKEYPFIRELIIEFEWYPGFAKSQAQKSIASQHRAAIAKGISRILEISSKSFDPLGISLSAFNLKINLENANTPGMSVECAFQGSKVFQYGGPYHDLYKVPSIEAKKDPRIRNSGDLVAFNFLGESFPITPVTVFYDWLYITALYQNPKLSKKLLNFEAFSDIAFNPQKSLNCQARAAALFVALNMCGEIEKALQDKKHFFCLLAGTPIKQTKIIVGQINLFQ